MNNEMWQQLLENKLFNIASVFLIAFITSFLMQRIINLIASKVLGYKSSQRNHEVGKRINTLSSVLGTVVTIIIWTTAILVSMNIIGFKLETLLTSAGIVGVIISFGAQTTIRDALAGFFIIAENQFRVGDVIKYYYAGQQISGTVEEVTLRITKIRDSEGNLHIIRNGFSEVITNRTFEYANASIELIVDYETDIDQLETIINQIGDAMILDPQWRKKIITPVHFRRVAAFEPSGVRIKAAGQVEAAAQWKVSSEFLRRLKKAFEDNHIKIGYNQITIHQAK